MSLPGLQAARGEAGASVNRSRAPILVTGMHRSGTTWVGRMIAAHPGVGYVDEPLNAARPRGILNTAVEHWYQYICDENEAAYREAFERTLAFRYDWPSALRSARSGRAVVRVAKESIDFRLMRARRPRPLLKDPFAVFSLPWFTGRLGCRAVVTVRHPAAVAASLKRLRWRFELTELLGQPLLMRDRLDPLRGELAAAAASPADDVVRAGLLWRAIYGSVLSLAQEQPERYIVRRHEDLARSPLEEFEVLYRSLGVPFTDGVRAAIRRSAASSNPREGSLRRPTASVALDSRAQIDTWRRRLSPDEVDRVREAVGDVSGPYYSDGDWGE